MKFVIRKRVRGERLLLTIRLEASLDEMDVRAIDRALDRFTETVGEAGPDPRRAVPDVLR